MFIYYIHSMIETLTLNLTNENIYMFANFGVIPFWLLLIFLPSVRFTKILAQSVIAPLLLGISYAFLSYKIYLEGNIFDGFQLYQGLDGLYTVFSNETFLLIFWLHFLSLSLFIGSWIARDSERHMIPQIFSAISLAITYFTGPIGLIFYWILRIFFARKINFNE